MPIPEETLTDVIRNELERYLREKVLPEFDQHLVDTFGVESGEYVASLGWDYAAITIFLEEKQVLDERLNQKPIVIGRKGSAGKTSSGFASGALPLRSK